MFKNRNEAGKLLAKKLAAYAKKKDVIVIGLPRGGVVLSYEIARALDVLMDVVVAKKLAMPGNPEAAIGAVTADGKLFLDRDAIDSLKIEQDYIDNEIAQKKEEAERRQTLYRADRSQLTLKNKIVILVDDGVATGSTMRAAIESVNAQEPKELVLAIPVAPPEFVKTIAPTVDKIICLKTPEQFVAVGAFYKHFEQIEDDEVMRMLE